MAVPFDTPVSAIEGIGPAAERLFQVQGVFSVYDLLRASSPVLHTAVAAVASIDEVKAWRQMAVLLEVAAVTPQWAEALVRGGITSVGELQRLDLAELTTVFSDARTAGTIPDVPTTDQMVAMLADAGVLEYAGAITGTVKDRNGNPLKGASIAGGGRDALTDDRGRFRLRRLLLGHRVTVTLMSRGLQTTTMQLTPLPTANVDVLQFVMLPEVASLRPRPSGRTAGSLSELNGDVMPAPVGANVTSGEVAITSLKSGDLLTLTEFYANGTDAKLVSKLLEYDGSRLVVHWVRLPRTDLPADAVAGDHFLRVGSGFRRLKMTPKKLADYKKLLQVRRSLPPRVPATTPEERYVHVAETLAQMSRRRS
jgi:hypothetical protein